MTKVYLIRHGEAEGNVYRRANGWHDGKITGKGLRQIDALAERFRDVQIDALYSSDLSRTVSTAGAITKYHDLELIREPGLREIHMGIWEGLAWGNITRQQPDAMYAFNNDPDRWIVDGAETWPEVKRRIHGVITELAARHEGQTIACVTHGVAIRAFLSLLMGIKSEDIGTLPYGDNTAVTLLEVEGEKMNIVFYNDSTHLPKELSTFARQSWWKKESNSVDKNNLVFEAMDLDREMDAYIGCYKQAWLVTHGDLRDFDEPLYRQRAMERYRDFPLSQIKAISGDETVGVSDLDIRRGREEGYGWLCLLCVDEKHRRQMLGAQLLGNVFHICESLGFKKVRLNVAENNSGAIAFYKEYGFRQIGERQGSNVKLLLMERELDG